MLKEDKVDDSISDPVVPQNKIDLDSCADATSIDSQFYAKIEIAEIDQKQSSKDVKKSKVDPVETISFFELYRYATNFDYILLAIGLMCAVGQGILAAIQSIIFRDLSNTLIKGQEDYMKHTFIFGPFYDAAMKAIYMYTGYGWAIFILSTVSMSCWHTICERQVHQIRKRYFAAVLRQNQAWFDEHDSGELTTRMTDGINRIKDGIGDKMGILFTYGTGFIAGLVVAFVCSWRMTLVMLAFIPLLAGLAGFLTQFVSASVRQEMSAYERAGAIAEEVIIGIRTVISLNGQQFEVARYKNKLGEASRFGMKKAFYIAFGTGWLFCLIFVAMGVAFWYGTKLYIDGLITPGAVFATFWAIIGGTMSLGLAAPQIGVLMGAKNAGALIFSVIDREPEINCDSKSGKTFDKPRGEIEFKNVCFHYPSRPTEEVLKAINFKVGAEQSIALVGPSGSGKSTIFGLFLRFYNQNCGQITFDGVPICDLNIQWLRQMVGVVSQEPVLFAATVEANLRLGNEDMTADQMEHICRMANAHNFIRELPEGYKTRIGEGGVQLSGGQKQRLAIARALARDPKILLLDEATSALDTESEKLVQHALDRASAGRTTITIAHRLSTIRHSDNIIVFENGQIVESGTHDELMTLDGTYKRLVIAQEIERSTKESRILPEEEPETPLPAATPTDDVHSHRRMSRRVSSTQASSQSTDRGVSGTMSMPIEKEIQELRAEAGKLGEVSLKEILIFAKREWPLLATAVVASLLKGFTFPIFSLVYGSMFRALAKPNNVDKLDGAKINAIYFTLLGIGSGIATFFGGFFFGFAGESLTKRLRIALFNNIVQQDGEFFDSLENSSGKLITRLATDAPNIRTAIDQRLSDVVQSLSAILAGIGIAFYYGPKMAPIGILTAMILLSMQTMLAQYLKRKGERDQKLTNEPSRLSTEAIEQHKTVQCLTREELFCTEFNRLMCKPHKKSITHGLIQAFTFGLHACYIFFNFAAAYRFGIWLIETNSYSPYIVFQVIEALNIASMSLLAIGTYFPEYIRGRLSATLLLRMINVKPKIDSLWGGGRQKHLDGTVCMKDVHFAYPVNRRRLVLRGFNLDALKGKTVALVGPSGGGKSTVVQLLERFYDPLHGKLLFDDELCIEMNLQKLRSQLALVSQEPTLFNYSVRDNIAYALPNASQIEVEEAAKQANAHEFIKQMDEGYETTVGEKGSKLSGGQKQRIAIARAIIRKPVILLLDEATSALDSESENVIQEALDRARAGRTCIVIAHRLSSIQNADSILVINDGMVTEYGTHQELSNQNGLYARLTKMQDLN